MRFVAFLRAINVGGHIVKMDRLRSLFEEMGFDDVSTYIASGNVILESALGAAEVERQAAEGLEAALGYEVGVFVRTADELRQVLEGTPFSAEELDGSKLYVCFLPSDPGGKVAEEVADLSTADHRLRVRGRELYWLARGSIARTDVDERALGRVLGMPMTMRNVNTVRKIIPRAEAG